MPGLLLAEAAKNDKAAGRSCRADPRQWGKVRSHTMSVSVPGRKHFGLSRRRDSRICLRACGDAAKASGVAGVFTLDGDVITRQGPLCYRGRQRPVHLEDIFAAQSPSQHQVAVSLEASSKLGPAARAVQGSRIPQLLGLHPPHASPDTEGCGRRQVHLISSADPLACRDAPVRVPPLRRPLSSCTRQP